MTIPPPLSSNEQDISRVIVLLALAAFASSSSFRVCDPILPQLADEFGVSTGQSADVVTWFAIAYGVLQFFYGPVSDRYGKFLTLSFATLGCAAGSMVVAMAPTLDIMVIGRFVSGATAAGIIPLSMAWIGDHIPYAHRQVTLSRFMLGTVCGVAAGQVMGGVFADLMGWRSAFYFLALLYLICGVLLLSQLKTVPEKTAESGRKLQLLAPILQVAATPWARVVLIAVFLEGAFVFGALSFVPAFLQEKHGLSASWAGAIASLFAAGALIYVFKANTLIKTLGEVKLVTWGGWVLAISFACYLASISWYLAVLGSVLCGFGYYLLHAVLQTNATQMAPAVRGTAVSLFASCLFLGQSAGTAIGAVFADRLGLSTPIWTAALCIPLVGWWFASRLALRPQA